MDARLQRRDRQAPVRRLQPRDIETALGLLHPDVVFEPVSGAILNNGQPYRGHEGMRRYFADVQEHWHELHVTPVHTRAAGDAVVALGQTSGRE